MESETQEKQNFLIQEIVDKGYSPEQFVEMLTSHKQNGDKIELWTLQELKEMVKKYVTKKTQSSLRSTAPHKQQNPSKAYVQCKKYDRFLGKDLTNIEAAVQKPEIVTIGGFMGFGATSVLWYTVKTSIVQNQVRRSDADFDWLRATLVRFHPNRIIPPLAKSRSILPDDTKALFKRGQMIKLFIENLSKCQPLMNCKLTVAFLTWGDYPRFQSFKKQQTTHMSALSPQEFITQSGKVEITVSQDNNTIMKQINKYKNSTKEAYDEIRQSIKDVIKNFQDLTASIYRIGNGFATLQEKHSDLTTAVPELRDDSFNQLVIGLNNCVIQWGRTFNVRRKAIEKHLSLMLKYTVQENEILGKVLRRRSVVEQQYTKMRMQLHKKKQKLQQQYPSLTKVNIPFSIYQNINIDQISKQQLNRAISLSEFRAQSQMRSMLGSLNSFYESQFVRLQPIILERFKQGFKGLGKSILDANKSQVEVATRMNMENC